MNPYAIYSINPTAVIGVDDKRLVEVFDTYEDAMVVKNALESVNVNFNLYKVEELK